MKLKDKIAVVLIVSIITFCVASTITAFLFGKWPAEWGATEWLGIALTNLYTLILTWVNLRNMK